MPAFVFRRAIRFDEIDAAGLVYFPRVIALAHEALERLLAEALPAGYASFVRDRRIGLPCVHAAADFTAPLRFGDDVEVASLVTRFGATSVRFEVRVTRVEGSVACARIDYVVACATLDGPKKSALPSDLREALARYAAG